MAQVVNMDGKVLGKDILKQGAKGWITSYGKIVVIPPSSDHYEPAVMRAIGTDSAGNISPTWSAPFDEGNVRFIAGYDNVFLQGTPDALEAVKYIAYDSFGDKKYIVDDDRTNFLGEYRGADLLDVDFYETPPYRRFRGRQPKLGHGWWGDYPGHREAALKRKYL